MSGTHWLTHEDFAGRIGEHFAVSTEEGQAITLELVEATQGREPGGLGPEGQERLQFSLVFRGPAQPMLPQSTYALRHDELGEVELFLVPIGPGGDGMRYEAVFA